MALVWAPRNSMNCIVFIFFRLFHFDFPIMGFVALYVGWEIVVAGLNNFQMSSAILHLAGAMPGLVVAAVMLKLGLVDCENWDIFAVLGNRVGKQKQVKPDPKRAATLQKNRESLHTTALAHFAHHLREGRAAEALALHKTMGGTDGSWQLSQQQRLDLVKALHKRRLWSQSVMPMVEFLRHAPDAAPRVRLKLAQILVVHEKRPGRALSVLEKIPAGSLGAELENARKQLDARARKMYDEGDIEVETDDW